MGKPAAPERCRHGTNLWCEDCTGESWRLGIAVGREEGIAFALGYLRDVVGKLYTAGKDDEASGMRAHLRAVEAQAKLYAADTEEVREAQGVGRKR